MQFPQFIEWFQNLMNYILHVWRMNQDQTFPNTLCNGHLWHSNCKEFQSILNQNTRVHRCFWLETNWKYVLVYDSSRKWMMLKVRYNKRYRRGCKKRKRTFLHMWYPKSCWVRTCENNDFFSCSFFCTFLTHFPSFRKLSIWLDHNKRKSKKAMHYKY